MIYDYARDSDADALLTVVRTGQQHLAEVIRAYLQPVTYGEDGWVQRMRLPTYAGANVVVDPHQAFGQPVVIDGGARVEDLVDRFQAGDSAAEISDDFGVPLAGSKTYFASRFGVPPEFFIDRSLGRHAAPAALREVGGAHHGGCLWRTRRPRLGGRSGWRMPASAAGPS